MVTALGTVQASPLQLASQARRAYAPTEPAASTRRADILDLGKDPALAREKSGQIVLERALNQLRAVVDEARAALGLEESQVLDPSEEATAGRIVDFALQFFARYAENNGLADDEEGRGQFASFIGAAIDQGISEAEGILSALNVTPANSGFDIAKTRSIIQERLADFVANGR